VVPLLQAAGVAVAAPPNPLRSLSGDAAYTASVVSQIDGPVVLVGHSYGGAVITNTAPQAGNVVGLVYIAAFIPNEGESLENLTADATGSLLGPAVRQSTYPTADSNDPGVELSIDIASFHEVFAADLPAEQAAVMAVSQRPLGALSFGEPSGPVGWKTLPTWALISNADMAIGAAGERRMAERAAGDQIVEIDGASHAVMLSQPQLVTDLILTALNAVS
jgi:pimeloyl-ACP methyl ester carboxylesterase